MKRSMKLNLVAILVAIVNTVFYSNRIVSGIGVLIEVFILIWLFIHKRYIDYIGMYIIFCGLSIEYEQLVDDVEFYGFKNTRIFGVNLGILTLLPIFFVAIRYIFCKAGNKFNKFYRLFMTLQVIGLVVGVFLVFINENGVQIFENVYGLLFNNFYLMSIQLILLIVCFMMVAYKEEPIDNLEDYFLSLFFGVVGSLIVSVLLGIRGTYGGVNTLVVSNNVRWLPIMLLLPIYPKYKNRLDIWIAGSVGAVLTLMFNATGKMVIMYALIPIIYGIICFINHRYMISFFLMLSLPIIGVGLYFGAMYLSSINNLFNSKMKQALSVFDFITGKINSSNVSGSPRVRIYELLNIIEEYIKKPWFALFGKGVMGTVHNYANLPFTKDAYSMEQWRYGLFYRMHESISKIFLMNGLLGVFFVIRTIKDGILIMAKTPWIVVGLYWFIISYGHSITMTAFGFSCLLWSFIQYDRQKEYPEWNNVISEEAK